MKNFSDKEREIVNLFKQCNEKLVLNGDIYQVDNLCVGKPVSDKGEPKTDIYVRLIGNNDIQEVKISYKKKNADFLENKIKKERAIQIFGQNWESTIKSSIWKIKHKFDEKPLVFKEKSGRTTEGSFTLGWKFEILNKLSGQLSGVLTLNYQQLKDIYAGSNLQKEKKNAVVNGQIIVDSGIANYMLIGDDFTNAQDVLDKLVTIDDYIKNHPKLYFACKALNYRSKQDKFDGNRSLAVYVDWSISSANKLTGKLVFDQPLNHGGKEIVEKLKSSLSQLEIKTTDDITIANTDSRIIYPEM